MTEEYTQEAEENFEETEQSQEAQEEVRTVPITALQKERRKRQETQRENEMLKKQRDVEDESQYESVTKKDLANSKAEWKRETREEDWVRENPEKFERVNQDLETFLETRPHLKLAIAESPNRYREAWELMSALSPKQQKQLAERTEPRAPHSPANVPKSAAMDQNISLMEMTDKEFHEWRQSKIRGR